MTELAALLREAIVACRMRDEARFLELKARVENAADFSGEAADLARIVMRALADRDWSRHGF